MNIAPYKVEPSHVCYTPGRISYSRLGEQRAPALHLIKPRPAGALGECCGKEHESQGTKFKI